MFILPFLLPLTISKKSNQISNGGSLTKYVQKYRGMCYPRLKEYKEDLQSLNFGNQQLTTNIVCKKNLLYIYIYMKFKNYHNFSPIMAEVNKRKRQICMKL